MRKWLKYILAVVILGFLVWYLQRHWEQLKFLVRLNKVKLFLMYLIEFLIVLSGSRIMQCQVNALGVKTTFWDMVRLYNVSGLLNYAPMKFGTFFRANYLKKHYGFGYAHFATFFLYSTFLMTGTASVIEGCQVYEKNK